MATDTNTVILDISDTIYLHIFVTFLKLQEFKSEHKLLLNSQKVSCFIGPIKVCNLSVGSDDPTYS